jgi:hypothetical protein
VPDCCTNPLKFKWPRYFDTAGTPRLFEQKHLIYNNVEENKMKVKALGETLNVSGIKELGAANSQDFRDGVTDFPPQNHVQPQWHSPPAEPHSARAANPGAHPHAPHLRNRK